MPMHDFAALTYIRINDRVEDRSMMTGIGRVVTMEGNYVVVRYDDGSEEHVEFTLFEAHGERHWII